MVVYRDPTTRVKSGKGWRDKRVPKYFTDEAEAIQYRDAINETLLTEGTAGVAFDAVLRADAIGARRKLDSAGHPSISLVWLAEQYCGRITKAGASGEDIGPIVEAFLQDKEFVDGRSEQTVGNLKRRLWQWMNREQIRVIRDITPETIDQLRRRPGLRKQGIGARTRINDIAAVSSFCTYLFDQKKLPFHPVRGLKRPHAPAGAKPTFNVEECARLLTAAAGYRNGKWLGTIATLLFVGPRPSELDESRFSYGRPAMARIEGGKLRGRANRVVKLTAPAVAWLRAAGKPAAVRNLTGKARKRLCELAAVVWKEDICRHTCISYRASLMKNDKAVAREFGTSEDVIYRSYHKPMTEADARKWAALRPAKKLTLTPAAASIAA